MTTAKPATKSPLSIQDALATRDAVREEKAKMYVGSVHLQIDAQIAEGKTLLAQVSYAPKDKDAASAILKAICAEFPGFAVTGSTEGCTVTEPRTKGW